jgi:hypothetical protein
MKLIGAAALALLMTSGAAMADDDPQLAKAEAITYTLGPILGSEKACDLEYNVDVIKDFILKHVAADNAYFPDVLQTATSGWEIMTKEMSPSRLEIHCVQIRRVAKQYGLWWRMIGSAVEHASKLCTGKDELDFKELFISQEETDDEDSVSLAGALEIMLHYWPKEWFAEDVCMGEQALCYSVPNDRVMDCGKALTPIDQSMIVRAAAEPVGFRRCGGGSDAAD